MINFECSEINVLVLPPKKWSVLHPKLYAEYKDSDHIHKIFSNFECTVSSDRSLFTLLNYYIKSGIWALETIYLASSVPCKVKTLALYGLSFYVLD